MNQRRKPKEFLRDLQNSSEENKKRWATGIFVTITILMIVGWIGYAGSFLGRNIRPVPGSASSGTSGTSIEAKASVIDSLRSGIAVVTRGTTRAVGAIGDALQAPKEYIIDNK